jgi:hypothetical protein
MRFLISVASLAAGLMIPMVAAPHAETLKSDRDLTSHPIPNSLPTSQLCQWGPRKSEEYECFLYTAKIVGQACKCPHPPHHVGTVVTPYGAGTGKF